MDSTALIVRIRTSDNNTIGETIAIAHRLNPNLAQRLKWVWHTTNS